MSETAATGGSADPGPPMLYLCLEVAGCPLWAVIAGAGHRIRDDAAGRHRLGCAETMFEPWPTTGVPLAVRDDWLEVLEAAATGTVNL